MAGQSSRGIWFSGTSQRSVTGVLAKFASSQESCIRSRGEEIQYPHKLAPCRFYVEVWCLTLFGSGCYTRRVPFGRGFALVVRTLGLFKLNRQVEPTTTLDPFRQSAKQPASVPHP